MVQRTAQPCIFDATRACRGGPHIGQGVVSLHNGQHEIIVKLHNATKWCSRNTTTKTRSVETEVVGTLLIHLKVLGRYLHGSEEVDHVIPNYGIQYHIFVPCLVIFILFRDIGVTDCHAM